MLVGQGRRGTEWPRTVLEGLDRTRAGQTVAERAAELRRRPGVLSATPNYIAHASYIPNDPGRTGAPGGWQADQWNFVGPFGVNAPAAWDHVAEAGRPGATGAGAWWRPAAGGCAATVTGAASGGRMRAAIAGSTGLTRIASTCWVTKFWTSSCCVAGSSCRCVH